MTSFITQRGDIITAIVAYLPTVVTEFALVKPYEGELDRYAKKAQIKADDFPADVNLRTPFALVISKDRVPADKSSPGSLRFKHLISIYIGVSNQHLLGSTIMPSAFALLSKCAQCLHGNALIANSGALSLTHEGEYLVKTDLFTVYDQKYEKLETGF